MPDRNQLPNRRECVSFPFEWGGLNKPHFVTIGYFPDGSIGEVFINGGKSGEQVEAIARDCAILLSLALQYGADLEAISHAITRDGQDCPQTVVGAIIDKLIATQSLPQSSQEQESTV